MPDGLPGMAATNQKVHVAITVTRIAKGRTRGAVLFKAAEIDGRTRFLPGFVSSTLLTGDGAVVEIARWTSREAYVAARATPAYAEQLAILGDFASGEELVLGEAASWPEALATEGAAAVAVTLQAEGEGAAQNGESEGEVLVVADPNRRRVGTVLTGASAEAATNRGVAPGTKVVFGPLVVFSALNRPGPEESALAYVLAPDPAGTQTS